MKRIAALWFCACSSLFADGTLSMEQIGADPGLWPSEVMVVVDHKLPVVKDGKTIKTRKAGPGKMYLVKSIDAKGVTLIVPDSTLTFKADDTDLISRAEQIKALREAPVVAPAPAPVQPDAVATPKMVAFEPESRADTSAPAPAAEPAARSKPRGGSNALTQKLDGLLVRNKNGKFEPFDAAKLGDKKFIAVYFSASWCGPCRRFTPSLVQWYLERKAKSDDFEVIFVSLDREERDMNMYMVNDHMEWPAVSFKRIENNPLMKYSGQGIPCLVILDSSGSVVSHSYEGDKYLGPVKPLKDLERLLSTL